MYILCCLLGKPLEYIFIQLLKDDFPLKYILLLNKIFAGLVPFFQGGWGTKKRTHDVPSNPLAPHMTACGTLDSYDKEAPPLVLSCLHSVWL
jgi:hypothetical protein